MGLFNVKQPVVRPSSQPAKPLVLIVRLVAVLLVTIFVFEPVESIVGYGSLQPEATFHHRQYRPQYRRRQVVTSCKPRHYHDWHPPLPIPPIPHFWTETASPRGQYQYEGNQQYSPVVRIVEPYSLPQRQFHHKEEDKSGHFEQPSIKPSSDTTGSSSQEFYDPPQLPSNPYRENPEHPVIYRIQNNKKKKTRKRKKKPKQHKEYQGFVGTTPGYSVNKIIVIEESDIPKENNQQAGGNQAEKSSPQQPESQSEFNKNPFINIKDFYPKRPESNEHHHGRGNQMTTSTTSNQNQLPIDHLVGSLPAKSIQEIHQRLNQTLMLNNLQGKNRHSTTPNRQQSHGTETLHTNANNLGVNLSRDSINSTSQQAPQVPGTPGQPYMIKDTGQMTNYSDFFIKSNKFAYENSWNYLTSTSTESSTLVDSQQQEQKLNSDSLGSSKVNDRLISGNTPSRKWMSMSANSSTSITTPSPPVYYFTSQRNFIPLPTTGTKPTTTSLQTSGSDKIFAARKRGQNIDPNHIGEPDSKSHTHKQQSKLDISKVATIIFGFCISMMVLAGLILVVLHKETVTERLRTLSESIETRYSNRFGRSNNRPPDSESGSNPGNDAHFHHHQAHHQHHHHHPQHLQPHRQNRHPESHVSQLSLAPPPPPPPPPPPLPPLPPQLTTHPQCVHTGDSEREPTPPPQQQQNNRRINQDLIEEIIGRPENSFTNKKCRQYFSRVHRWVPKRPALPDNLKHISTNIDPNVTNEP